jgi:hypothetical protein
MIYRVNGAWWTFDSRAWEHCPLMNDNKKKALIRRAKEIIKESRNAVQYIASFNTYI